MNKENIVTDSALTFEGRVPVIRAVPLGLLAPGDTVLGLPDPDDPAAPRTTHVVYVGLGSHYVPSEDPGAFEKFLIAARLQRLVAGPRVEGILVNGNYGPGLFALEDTPVLDRVAR